jgi:hypothetical protein
MKEPVCAICKGGKLLCGKKFCPILQRLKYWKSTIEKVKDSFFGTTPPSVFVGRYNYPRVNVGVLSPPMEVEQAEKLDFPEVWYEERASIRQILDYRSEMILSRRQHSVKRPKGDLLEAMQELAVSKRAVDVEVWLRSKPKFLFSMSNFRPPIGNPALVKQIKIAENVRVVRKVDRVISDTDLKAGKAVLTLYRYKVPVSKIEKIFSVGLLGLPFQRKLVPTRWSITSVDDIIGRNLRERVKKYPEIPEVLVFHNEYIGNHYEIIFIPGAYEYELIEIKHPKSVWNPYGKQPVIYSDHEPYWGRKDYASSTGGAFYAGRISTLEFLEKNKKQASILIIREVLPSYYAPLGIWQMRETIRGSFENKPEKFSSVEEALERVSTRLHVPIEKILPKSKLFRKIKEQKKIKQYLTNSYDLSSSRNV